MLKYSVLIGILFSLNSCNAPLDERRGVQVFSNSSESTDTTNPNNTDPNNNNPNSNTNTGSGFTNNLGSGFENCALDPQHYVSGAGKTIGPLGICKSSLDPRSFAIYFQDSSMSMNDATCFIPTHRDSSGASTPLGMAQCTMHAAGDTKKAYLATNSSNQINGVMIMKYSSVNSYFGCMQTYQNVYPIKYQQYLQSCGLGTQVCQNNANQYADIEAKKEQNYICGTFKQSHPYIDVTLPTLSQF